MSNRQSVSGVTWLNPESEKSRMLSPATAIARFSSETPPTRRDHSSVWVLCVLVGTLNA